MAEITLTGSNFDTEVLHSSEPVLVDFWAAWCGPCQMLAPILSEIAVEKAGACKVGKVNVDEQPALASRFGIRSIPTLLLFRNGTLAATLVGYHPKSEILDFLG